MRKHEVSTPSWREGDSDCKEEIKLGVLNTLEGGEMIGCLKYTLSSSATCCVSHYKFSPLHSDDVYRRVKGRKAEGGRLREKRGGREGGMEGWREGGR